MDETAYVIGAIIGRLVGALLIALFLRFIYVKVRGGERRVWSPWLILIVVVLLVVAVAGSAGAT